MLLAAAGQFAMANWVGRLASFTVFFPAIVAGALLGAGPGALGLGLSLAVGWSYWTWTAASAPPGSRDALDLFLIALSGALIVLIIETYRRRQSPFSDVGLLFKAVQEFRWKGWSSIGLCSIAAARFTISNTDTPIRLLARS